MDNPSLVLDLVEWVAREPRRYAEVMEAWRTSCPRLSIWEDAVDQGYLRQEQNGSGGSVVRVTPAGQAFLKRAGRWRPADQGAQVDVEKLSSGLS